MESVFLFFFLQKEDAFILGKKKEIAKKNHAIENDIEKVIFQYICKRKTTEFWISGYSYYKQN